MQRARSKEQGARGIEQRAHRAEGQKRSENPDKCTAFGAGERRDCLETDFTLFALPLRLVRHDLLTNHASRLRKTK